MAINMSSALINCARNFRHLPRGYVLPISCYATKAEKKKGIDRKLPPKIANNILKLESEVKSIQDRGFLRPCAEYNPPADYAAVVHKVVERYLAKSDAIANQILPLDKKALILEEVSKNLMNHTVTNSVLHRIKTVGDVVEYYSHPVTSATPLDQLSRLQEDKALPSNLCVETEYKRWQPNSHKFFGITAFPESSTLVTGLKYRKKYPGHKQEKKPVRK